MKSNKKISFITYGVSFIIFVIIALWGNFFLNSGDEIGYVVLNFAVIMPTISFIGGIVLGIKDAYLKWLYPIVFGILGIIIPSFVFKGSWDWTTLRFALIPAFIGLLIGILIKNAKKRNELFIKYK